MQTRLLSSKSIRCRCHGKTLATAVLWLAVMGASYASDTRADVDAQSKGFAALESIAPEDMRTARGEGGAGVDWVNVQSIQEMEAKVDDASFVVGGDIVTGDITFDSDAIGNYHGVGVFNVITGNANAVNSAVGISIYMTR